MAKTRNSTRKGTSKKESKANKPPIKVSFIVPPGFPITYVDHATVQHINDEFIISFFQSDHPLILSEDELEKLSEVRANCVIRLALNPNKMALFTNAVMTNFNKWQAAASAAIAEAESKDKK